MFSFQLKSTKQEKDWKIIINDHTIECSMNKVISLSPVISKHIKKEKNKNPYSITIPEFENSLVCSEADYQYFDKIFNYDPVQISNSNSNVLKIFAEKFEIKELLSLIEIFESFYDIISNDQSIQTQKDITNELIDIEESSFDTLLDHFNEIEQSDNNIITLEFIYHIFLSACIARPTKIELLMDFLKKYEEKTQGKQFDYFKKTLLKEMEKAYTSDSTYHQEQFEQSLYSNYPFKSVYFILNYLQNIKEIDQHQIKRFENYSSSSYRFNFYNYNYYSDNQKNKDFTNEEIEEYKNTGYNPTPIYQSIKNDDLDLFTQLMTQKTSLNDFNNQIVLLEYERNPDLLFQRKEYSDEIRNLELAAAYGSEKIFNYILLNMNDVKIDPITVRMAFIGRNNSIIHKCLEYIEMDDNLLEMCLVITIKYNYYELFEWLYEENEVMNNKKVFDHLITNAIKFNNMDVVIFLLSNGFDYTPLFILSLIYNQFILAKLATKLPYERNIANIQKQKIFQPYNHKYNGLLPIFVAIYKDKLDFVKIIINSKKFDHKVKCDLAGPLFFSLIYEKFDIFKFLLEDKRFTTFQMYKTMNLFEYCIKKNQTKEINLLILNPDINTISNYSYSYLSDVQKKISQYSFRSFSSDKYNDNYSYPTFLLKYFLTDSGDENIEKIKKEILIEDKLFFLCLAARYSDEQNFECFLDKYEVDINEEIPDTVFKKKYFK